MFRVKFYVESWRALRNPCIETDWKWLIRLAWGERRVSSRAAPGTEAYPRSVAATFSVWIAWVMHTRKWRFDCVVVSAEGADHGAAYIERLAAEDAQREAAARATAAEAEKRVFAETRLAEMQARRDAARAAKDFALADQIRAEIIAAGFEIADKPIRAITAQTGK